MIESIIAFLALLLSLAVVVERGLEALPVKDYIPGPYRQPAYLIAAGAIGVIFALETNLNLFADMEFAAQMNEDWLHVLSGLAIGAASQYTHQIERLLVILGDVLKALHEKNVEKPQ